MEFLTIENAVMLALIGMVACIMQYDYKEEKRSNERQVLIALWRQYLKNEIDSTVGFGNVVYPFLEESGYLPWRNEPATECDILEDGIYFYVKLDGYEHFYQTYIPFGYVPLEVTNKYELSYLKVRLLEDYNKFLKVQPQNHFNKNKEFLNDA